MASRVENTLFLLNASSTVWRAIEEFHYRLAAELCKKGANVVIVLARPVPEEVHQRLEASGAKICYLAYRNRFAFSLGLRKLIRDNSISTVHVRFFRLNQFISWFVWIQGVRTILYTDAESNESNARGLKRLLKRARTRFLTAPVVRMVAISGFVKQRLVESGVPVQKVAVVHNGIDLGRFVPKANAKERLAADLSLNPEELILITISRFVDVKRVDIILRACAEIHSRGISFKLVLVGQGGPLESNLRRLSDSLGLQSKVIWYGPTDQPEILLSAADVFLLASCGEAFGNVLVESMSCGTPVVATRSGATAEIVADGECGILADADDASSFAKAIEKLAKAPELREKMGRAAKERAKLFDVENSVKGTLALYQSIWD